MEKTPELLYEDIYELFRFRGIKQNRIAQAMKMSYNNWFQSKKRNLSNISLDEIAELARFLNLPTEQVFLLCHAVYKRAQQEQQME